MPPNQDTRGAPDWLRPAAEQGGLNYYVEVLRERIWMVVAIMLITLVAAGAYLFTADDVYEGEARLLITPASGDDALMSSLGVLRASNDPTRDIETVATLATTVEVAERARRNLESDSSARSLLRRVDAEPIASSSLVSIIARGPTAAEAAELANAFADAVAQDRTAALHEAVNEVLPQLRSQLQSGDSAGLTPDSTLESDVARLEVLRERPDTTVRVETEAQPASSPVSPRRTLTIVGALLAGGVLGIAGAFAAQTLDPRLRREQQLRSRYNLPILARVPRDTSRRGRPLGPATLSMPAKEAYRTLRANVTAARRNPTAPHSVLVTGSSPSEGKTTSAINLAGSLALSGSKVILIEADLRRPAIGEALGIKVETGVVSTLLENSSLSEALVEAPGFGSSLQLLLADYKGGWMSELFSLHAAQRLLAAAKAMADYVIVDSPPLTTVVDTLPLARQADDVLIVSRLGVTRLDKLPELAELLASNGITPLGFALVGTERTESYYYHEDDGTDQGEDLRMAPPTLDPGDRPDPAKENGPSPGRRKRTKQSEDEPSRRGWRRSESGSGTS